MSYVPQVGDKVRLSGGGYKNLHLRSAEDIRQSQNMTITMVEDINAGSGWQSIWVIEVDQPAINRFMLDAGMVEPIKEQP